MPVVEMVFSGAAVVVTTAGIGSSWVSEGDNGEKQTKSNGNQQFRQSHINFRPFQNCVGEHTFDYRKKLQNFNT